MSGGIVEGEDVARARLAVSLQNLWDFWIVWVCEGLSSSFKSTEALLKLYTRNITQFQFCFVQLIGIVFVQRCFL